MSHLLLDQLDDLTYFLGDRIVALPSVGAQAIEAVLDTGFGVGVIAAAVFAQGVEGAVAEDAGEGLRVCTGVAGEVFAGFVLEKVVIWHGSASNRTVWNGTGAVPYIKMCSRGIPPGVVR